MRRDISSQCFSTDISTNNGIMILDVILFIAGAALVVLGADWLVDGASAVARRSGLSEYVIGATIVGIGTSMPEFVVSAIAALQGNADIAIGNVAGSNAFNTLLILGVTALILPLHFTGRNIRRDVPLCIAVSAALLLFALCFGKEGHSIARLEGIILLAGFTAYVMWCIRSGKEEEHSPQEKAVIQPVWKALLLVAAGLGGLISGGNLFVSSASSIALSLGVPQSVIAATLVAGGTSLPELAVCVVAAAKGRGQMAIGNIIGSNIANILLIVGFAATVSGTPLNVDETNLIGVLTAFISSLALMLSALPLRSATLSRWKALLFLALYAAYIVSIV